MYKSFLLSSILLLSAILLNAQTDSLQESGNKFLIGTHGGGTILGVSATFNPKDLSYMRPSFDYMYGISLQVNLRKRLSLRAELNYEKISAHGTYTTQQSPTVYIKKNWSYSYEYISLPIMLKHNVVTRERLCAFIEGGLFTNYFYSYYWSLSPDAGNDYISEHKRPNNLIFGVNFGTGMDIKLDSRMHLLLGTRHDIFGFQLRPTSESILAYSRFMIGASYSLK